jgi:hypothetical protein
MRNWGNLGFLAGNGLGFLPDFWKGGSEKGSTRKYTGNWVTRWINLFWGNLENLRCFAKRILLGEFKLTIFGDFTRWSTWVV